MTGIMKAQIEWIPISMADVRATPGKTLALMLMQVRRLAELQRLQPDARPRAVHAHGDDPKPVLGAEALRRVRPGWRMRPSPSTTASLT
jgi:hypothetical protein